MLAEAFVAGVEGDFDVSSYDFVGFSILSDTLPSTLGVIELVRKKYPRAKLVGGNHEATVNLGDCVGKSHLDAVILADAEEPMLALMRGQAPHEIPGVLWRTHNPKPPREKFEEWNRAIRWGEIPYAAYWERTAALYDWDRMSAEEQLDKRYEIHTVRIHSLVACELACTYSVTGDTLVFTDEGPVEIRDLMRGLGVVRKCVHGGETIEYQLDRKVASPSGRSLASHAVDEGVRPVVRVRTEGGFSVKATPEHKFLCVVNEQYVWKCARDLQVGDFVVVRQPEHAWATEYQKLTPPALSRHYTRRGSISPHRCPDVLDERLAWLCGFIVGDGSIPADGRGAVHMCVTPDFVEKQRAIVRELFDVELKLYPSGHTEKMVDGWIHSRLAREVLTQSIGIDPRDKLKIPRIFWRSPKTVLAAFLQGLYDADGYASAKSDYLTTVSEQLARDVALALLVLGRGCPNVQFVKIDPTRVLAKRDHYRISVFRNDRIPCTRSVYLSKSGWRWRTLKQKSSRNNGCVGIRRSTLNRSGLHHPLNRDGWYYMRVRSVEACAAEPVYDISVPGDEAFVANGLVAHNCSVANTRRIASGSTKPSIVNLSVGELARNLLDIKRSVPGVMTIYDSSDEAWLGRGRAEEYLAALESVREEMDAGLPRGMRYLIQCRTNDLTEELVDRASKVGVRHLTIGVESPVAQVRKDIKKPQQEEHIRNVIRWGAPRGIDVYMLFIMFLPTITLEQLREAVVNWRVYLELGATISVEPFCMSYLGTALHDDPTLMTEHVGYSIPFSGGKKLKWATLIWPHDRRVCSVLQWFRENVDGYIEEARRRLGHRHTFKGTTGKITVDCLEAALERYDAGELPPWEPGEGRRSTVYQDYGDQMSGSEIAAASMARRNKTASRFNSTHALLDDANAGIPGRIKDPALPHEMVEKK